MLFISQRRSQGHHKTTRTELESNIYQTKKNMIWIKAIHAILLASIVANLEATNQPEEVDVVIVGGGAAGGR